MRARGSQQVDHSEPQITLPTNSLWNVRRFLSGAVSKRSIKGLTLTVQSPDEAQLTKPSQLQLYVTAIDIEPKQWSEGIDACLDQLNQSPTLCAMLCSDPL